METTQWSAEYDLDKVKLEEAIREWEAGYNFDVTKFNESIRQWQLSFNESIRQWEAEFGQAVEEWNAEFGLAESDVTGIYNGLPTINATQSSNKSMAEAGWALLEAGIKPSASQLTAMGISSSQAQEYLTALKLQQSSKKYSGSGSSTSEKTEDKETISDTIKSLGTEAEVQEYILNNKVTESQENRIWDIWYAAQEEKENAPSQAMQEQAQLQAMYGSSFNQALAWANTMLANNVSDEEIEKRLSQFSASSLNQAGKLAIMQFIKSKRTGV